MTSSYNYPLFAMQHSAIKNTHETVEYDKINMKNTRCQEVKRGLYISTKQFVFWFTASIDGNYYVYTSGWENTDSTLKSFNPCNTYCFPQREGCTYIIDPKLFSDLWRFLTSNCFYHGIFFVFRMLFRCLLCFI